MEERRDGGSSGRNCGICGRACDCSWDSVGAWGWDWEWDCGCVWRHEVQICLQRWAEIVYVGAIVAVYALGLGRLRLWFGLVWLGWWFGWRACLLVGCGLAVVWLVVR